MTRRSTALVALLAALPLLAGACATNPATGRSQLSFFGEEAELDMGRDVADQIAATGAIYDDPELTDYVAGIGHELAAASERPYLPWSFQVLDDPTINAFALPGGHVYVTRGILAHLESEAELAAVLGHEIGHVTARHAINQMSKGILAAAGLGVAAILVDEDLAQWEPLGEIGLALMMLTHSRSDERQADDLGLRYLLRAGYDPRQMPEMFGMLERASEATGGGLPAWLSSHPDPGARRQRIAAEVSRLQAEGGEPLPGRVERETYLEQLAGLAYGPFPVAGGEAAGTGLADGEAIAGPLALAHIELAHVEEDLALSELTSRYCAPEVAVATVALLNRLPADGVVPAGSVAKVVVAAAGQGSGRRLHRKTG